MSSPLNGRIRSIAREEAATLLGGAPVSAALADGLTPTQDLQQQITDLHEHLHHAATTIKRLEDRIDVLERAAGQAEQQRPAVRRTARKDTSE